MTLEQQCLVCNSLNDSLKCMIQYMTLEQQCFVCNSLNDSLKCIILDREHRTY